MIPRESDLRDGVCGTPTARLHGDVDTVGRAHRGFDYQNASPSEAAGYIVPALLRLLGPLNAGSRVLDIGCGNGYLSGQLLQRGCVVVGIDVSRSGIAIARQSYPDARFEVLNAGRTMLEALGEEPFDAVVSMEVVEHLYSPRDFAVGCYRALRPRGGLVWSTPYHGYLKNLALALTNSFDSHWSPLHEGGHIKFWSRATLSRLVCEAGFTELRFAGAGRLPWLWKSMLLSAIRLDPLADAGRSFGEGLMDHRSETDPVRGCTPLFRADRDA